MNAAQVNITPDVGSPRISGAGLFDQWDDRGASPVQIALVGTFAPRKCGIATFTADIVDSLARYHPEIGIDIYALDDRSGDLRYDGVSRTIASDDAASYRAAAAQINASGVEAVWLQHEFGIFGGPDGELVRDFVDRIAAPLIVTLHTVLSKPSANQRAIIEHLAARASRIMVMARHSRELLVDSYGVPASRIAVIEHGAPDRPFGREEEFKARLGLAGKTVLMTFGLLGPGKGIEQVIEALPAIVRRHPDAIYRIVGATHPNLLAREGEAYRERLTALAETLGVSGHILWENRFLETGELLDQLEACDIYLTPYPNLQQSTSGTLSFAVALGKAVVSTPYIHARELLAGGAGVLIQPGSSAEIAATVCDLLIDPVRLALIRKRAYARGRETIWPCFAQASAALIDSAVSPAMKRSTAERRPAPAAVFAMSDGTGMLQHAIGPVPDRDHGYCVDDNARSLMLMHRLDDPRAGHHAMSYAAFIQHAWNPDAAGFRNFMRFDRSWCEELGSEDSNGRAVWALGDCRAHARDESLRRWARRWYETALPAAAQSNSPRTLAFAILGAAAMLKAEPDHRPSLEAVEYGAGRLAYLLDASRRPDWAWFEAVLAYDNARLPQALILAGRRLEREDWLEAGLTTLRWISRHQIAAAGHFRPIGSDSLGRGDIPPLPFDQQPLEAHSAIDAAAAAWRASGDPAWIAHAETAWAWFFGGNDRGIALADPASGRCHDGLTPHGVNENCGAESILAYQMAYYSMLALRRDTGKDIGSSKPGGLAHAEPLAHT